MTDREKVIKAVEHCKDNQHVNDCNTCDYGGKTGMFCIRMIDDILTLLKEQEPIPCGEKIKAGDIVLVFYECGYCKNAIRKPWRYCPFCGKKVKWDDKQ